VYSSSVFGFTRIFPSALIRCIPHAYCLTLREVLFSPLALAGDRIFCGDKEQFVELHVLKATKRKKKKMQIFRRSV